MSYIDDQRNRMNAAGSDYTSYFKNLMQHKVNESFKMASDVYTIQMEDSVTGVYNNITTRVTTALTKTMSSRSVIIHDDYRKIIFQDLNQIINLGQRFQFNGYYWITIDTANVLSITQSCIVKRCNNMLRFYDVNHSYHEIPCIVENTMGNILNDQYMLLPQGKVKAIVKYEDTAKLITLDPITRFILNGQAYKTISLDHISQVKNGMGYSQFMLEIDQITPYDDVVNGIADKNKPDNIHNYNLTITNGSSLSLFANSTLQLNATVTDNGNIVSSPSLTYTSSDPTIASVNAQGLVTVLQNGTCTITVAMVNDASVTATVSVSVSAVVSDSYSLSITSTSTTPGEIKNGQSKTYNATVSNNGVNITDGSQPVNWQVYADDQVSSTTLATITSQSGTSCTVTNNNANSGYVQLKCVLNSNPTVVTWLRIQMKSLF